MPAAPVKPYPKADEWTTIGLRLTGTETRALDRARRPGRQSRAAFVRWLVGAYLSGDLLPKADAEQQTAAALRTLLEQQNDALAGLAEMLAHPSSQPSDTEGTTPSPT